MQTFGSDTSPFVRDIEEAVDGPSSTQRVEQVAQVVEGLRVELSGLQLLLAGGGSGGGGGVVVRLANLPCLGSKARVQ